MNELIEHWRDAGRPLPVVDASRDAALRRAREVLDTARQGQEQPGFIVRSDFDKSCLYAIVDTVVREIMSGDARGATDRVIATQILSSAVWRSDSMEEVEDLQARLSAGSDAPTETHSDLFKAGLDSDWSSARRIIESCSENFSEFTRNLTLRGSETIIALCQLLDRETESGPRAVLDAAKQAYSAIESISREDLLHLGETREYVWGEFARIAGGCSRILSLRADCRMWLDRSSEWFRFTSDASANMARVSYQRLALHMEERDLDAVLQLAGPLANFCSTIPARELELKCRCVEAAALRESGRTIDAARAFEIVCTDAREIGSDRILGPGLVALTQIYSDLDRLDDALRLITEAEPLIRSSGDKISRAKLYISVGHFHRKRNRFPDAITAFRVAQQELAAIQMPADVAALHLVIADVLLETGQERQAEWEIRAALPVIDELKMVPEGFAAMSLLRESLRRRSIDRQALRSLHGYFEDLSS